MRSRRTHLAPDHTHGYPHQMRRQALRRLAKIATAFSAVVILFATLVPNAPDPGPVPDWLLHVLLFMSMGFPAALWYATSDYSRRAPQRALLTVILTLWLFGGLTELAQSLTETRSASFSDLASDVFGALVGFIIGGMVWRWLLRRA